MKWDAFNKAPDPPANTGGKSGLFDDRRSRLFSPALANTTDVVLPSNRRLELRTARRLLTDTRDLAAAIENIGRLPEPGESLHLITAGAYKGWDIVPAVLALAAPATCEDLTITTYAFNIPQITALCGLMDSGRIRNATLVCALLFQKIRPAIITHATEAITARGGRLLACRNHTKLYLMKLSDGRYFAGESSANLRSRGAIEQYSIFNDRKLYEYHAGWIEDLFAKTHR